MTTGAYPRLTQVQRSTYTKMQRNPNIYNIQYKQVH